MAFNVQISPWNDIRVRRAIQMAIDLETINRTYHKGWANPTAAASLGDAMVGYVTHLKSGPTISRDTIPMTRNGQKRCLIRLDIRAAPTAFDSRLSTVT